ncbi:apolipoprotein N-acyltransferase [Roseobacter sp. AzwK-3b]|uniref:apolipoprotein N-acyltransferase n=1 Tax=Roseobacter sp. AzwK-3b TaxID=351016 RepID=UPI0001569BF3|nr:apolipoprotein N-acyltransferase [Roseobacter sp. AzwK-3b]EDM72226.1 apolipoprotein N-acyltransferase [Roseobacter sp. AzwK-3b]
MPDTRLVGLAAWAAGLRPRNRLILCALIGALAGLGQAPWGLWPLTVAALAMLFAIFTAAPTWRRAGFLGWAAGTGYFMLSLNWIVEPFLVDVARHGWMAPFALFGLSAGLALFWAAGFALARAAGGGALAWIAALLLSEAARTYLFTGFPWAQTGHALIDTAWLHWASWGGSLMLTAIVLAAAAALWRAATGPRPAALVALALIAALHGAGAALTPAAQPTPDAPIVRLIQPNAAQHLKWHPDHTRTFFERQIAFTSAPPDGQGAPTPAARPDLIVWPETAIPVLLERAGPAFDAISAAAGGAPVVLGLQRTDELRYFNSLVMLDASGQVVALYDKHHLVPFGEYIPFGDFFARFGITAFSAQAGNGYSSGPGAQVIGLGDLGLALPLICYEGVFPQDVRAAPARPDMLLLITNDAWFGTRSGPYQHLAQARLRSVEQGLPMIRVANTGVSAMIDAAGRVTASIPLGQAGWRDAPLPPPLPPTIYARTGDSPSIGGALLLLALSFLRNRSPARSDSD